MSKLLVNEAGNGAETIEIVFGMIVAVGLGAALLTFQDTLRDAIKDAGENITSLFTSATSADLG